MPYIGNPIYQSAFVTDQFSGDGTTTAFTMSVAPAGTTNVLVVVSGVVQDPSTYGVVGTTLTFSAAPPSGTGNISCRYLGVPVTGVTTTAYRTVTEFTATASQTTFTPPSYNVGFINVYLNGVLLGSADYTATNGTTVVLATGASAGNLVTVESFLISSVANALSNSAGSVSSTNLATNSVTTTKIADGSVTPAKLSTGYPYWDTSGNFGVGTVAPTYQVEIKSADPRIALNNTGTGTWFTSSGWTGANDYSVVQAGVAERMRISSAGYVTMPNQPAFHAYRTSGAVSGTGVYICNATAFNDGSFFNTSTGIFTAPVAGRYQCNFFVLIQNPNNVDFNIYVNSAQYASMDIRANANPINGNFTLSVSAILKLSANDTVNPQITYQPSGSTYGSGLNGFSMYFLG